MKKVLSIYLLMMVSVFTSAQLPYVDSLKNRLSTAIEDSNKVHSLIDIVEYYQYVNSDTALYYGMQALRISQRLGMRREEAITLNHIGEALAVKGNYPRALEIQIKALKLWEGMKKEPRIVLANCYVGNVYYYSRDYANALVYYAKAKQRSESFSGYREKIVSGLIGESYFYLQRLDSALLNIQRAYVLDMQDSSRWSVPYFFLGHIYAQRRQFPLAIEFYRMGLSIRASLKDTLDGYLGLAKVFKNTDASDSAIYYSKQIITLGVSKSFLAEVVDAGILLKELYKTNGQIDSAFEYQEIMLAAKDSLFNQEKVKQMHNLSFNEDLRQMEIKEQQRQAGEERKKNLQLMGIAAFIATFLLFVFLLLRRKSSPRMVEMLGLVGLLLVFEFISLLIHPYIAKWTHHKPIYMMLILVAIAAILVPAHHRLTEWLKRKLLHKKNIHTG